MLNNDIQSRMFDELKQKSLLKLAHEYAEVYLGTLAERPVFPDQKALAELTRFDEPLPDSPQAGEAVLHQLHAYGSPATVAQTGGRYFGFVNGGVIPTALAARWIADTWDQNPALYVISPVVAKLEQVCERWLRELLGLPSDTVAGFVGGTSTATMCGLAAARYTILKRLGWDVNADGLFGAPPFRVVVSDQAHGTVLKALALLGLGKNRVECVAADAQGRIDIRQIPLLDDQTLLILQAGNVNTGAFDDFEGICDQARQAGAWVHVDGAFGLWAAAADRTRYLTQGLEKADSWSVDAHKTLNAPYDCGIILCRHPDDLVAAMQASGAYIQYSDERDGMLYVPDMSRRARAVDLWATLKYLGRQGVEALVEGLCDRARHFADRLRGHGFQILNEVVFNQVLVACDIPSQTQQTLTQVQRSGECWCGPSLWNGQPAIRISICAWATTEGDIDRSADQFIRARKGTL